MRWKILIVLALLCTSAIAQQSFLSDFTNCYQAIRVNHGYAPTNTDFATDTVLSWYLRQSVVEVACYVMGFEFDTTFITSEDKAVYNFGGASDIWGVSSVIWSKGDSTKALKYVPSGLWPDMEHQTCVGKDKEEARPSYYECTDDYLRLFPSPNQSNDTLVVRAYGIFDDIDTASAMDSLSLYYRMAIVNHATWKLAVARSLPTTETFRLTYEESRNMATVMRDRRIKSGVPTVTGNK